ncbi:hypothetical protein Swit_3669 [Rhizorhabdus wittichii RW1]|uniref:Uncharacterized protein n=1 Tax=Rhizorhabdus wittichii (strain DSM 6014 / CCUG 31198 / JCM 15750 / NBRC 105917 / EY 4224 / RW1) TaxID=392499 RepID=A0A9J9HE51_RHIWR|nr:hypothetical protein Swit_3669 [Rhizorhabdus wittichii RW1]
MLPRPELSPKIGFALLHRDLRIERSAPISKQAVTDAHKVPVHQQQFERGARIAHMLDVTPAHHAALPDDFKHGVRPSPWIGFPSGRPGK